MTRSFSDKHELPANPIWINFPRSDGVPGKDRHPSNTKREPDSAGHYNFYQTLDLDDSINVLWRKRCGEEIAKKLGKADAAKHVIQAWPQHYVFYDHHKGTEDQMRHDAYLIGSKHCSKFRSANEFVLHGYWLLTDETLDKSNCKCKYCGKKSQREVNQEYSLPSHIPTFAGPRVVRQSAPAKSVISPKQAASKDRIADLTSTRRHRLGELVWSSVVPPLTGEYASQKIEFWPAIVQECRVKSVVAPHGLGESYQVHQHHEYKLKLLGINQSSVLHEQRILPYQAHIPSSHLLQHLQEATLPPDIKQDRHLQSLAGLMLSTSSGSPQPSFSEAAPAYSLAIQIAATIVGFWTPTDEFDFSPDRSVVSTPSQPVSSSSPPPAQPPEPKRVTSQSGTELRYQGLWWGAERLWLGEYVRISPGREQLAPETPTPIYEPSPTAEGRCLVVKLSSIFIEDPSAGSPAHSKRSVRVSGPLFEVAEADWSDPAETPSASLPLDDKSNALSTPAKSKPGSVHREPYRLAAAPEGYRWRAILPPGYEIVLGVSQLAGRYYPDLFDNPLLRSLMVTIGTAEDQGQSHHIVALGGLLPGACNAMECKTWKNGRLTMIKEADALARAQLWEHWSKMLKEEEEDDVILLS